jgi:membrane protein DedA with SNARE-associated domain
MPEEVVYYVTKYGYLAIFIMVFLQEIGMPNPFPNELLLLFSGYLSYKGLLFLPFVILTAFAADFIGTNILYFLFYTTGNFIMQKKPKWVPLSDQMINKLTKRISGNGQLSICIFRLTPFTRGYTSVITGLLRVSPGMFLPIALFTAIAWASFYVLIGYLVGPSWNMLTQYMGGFKYLMLAILTSALFIVFIKYLIRNIKKSNMN